MLIIEQLLLNLPSTLAIVGVLLLSRVESSRRDAALGRTGCPPLARRLSVRIWTGVSVVSLIGIAASALLLRNLVASGDLQFVSPAILLMGVLYVAWSVSDSLAEPTTGPT